jgi:hypothetical protein
MTFTKSCLSKASRILLLTLLTTVYVNAQPDNPPPPDDVPVPITGLEYLLISGGILGGYKLFKNRNKGTTNQP